MFLRVLLCTGLISVVFGESSSRDIWLGTPPLCSESKAPCAHLDMEQVEMQKSKDCLSGTPVLCRLRVLRPIVPESGKHLSIVNFHFNLYPNANVALFERVCHFAATANRRFRTADVLVLHGVFHSRCIGHVSLNFLLRQAGWSFVEETSYGIMVASKWAMKKVAAVPFNTNWRGERRGFVVLNVEKPVLGGFYVVAAAFSESIDTIFFKFELQRMESYLLLQCPLLENILGKLDRSEPLIFASHLNSAPPVHAALIHELLEASLLRPDSKPVVHSESNSLVDLLYTKKPLSGGASFFALSQNHRQPNNVRTQTVTDFKTDPKYRFCSSIPLDKILLENQICPDSDWGELADLSSDYPVNVVLGFL